MRTPRGYARFNYKVAGLMIAWLAVVGGINYVVDPYGVFDTPYFPRPFEDNTRFKKIEYLKHHQDLYDSYILGSSRALAIDPQRLDQYLPGSHFFSLAVPHATQQQNLKHVEYLIAKNYSVRNLYIQVDLDFLKDTIRQDQYGQSLHPDVTQTSLLQYYLRYLLVLPKKAAIAKLKINLQGGANPQARRGQGEGGERSAQLGDRRHIRKDQLEHVTQNLQALKRVKTLCDRHRIRCIVVITPIHHSILRDLNPVVYFRALEELGQVWEFYDFSGYNSVTENDKNYIEPWHFYPHVGDLIAARIFDDPNVAVPNDFGVLVTGSNLGEHALHVRQMLLGTYSRSD